MFIARLLLAPYAVALGLIVWLPAAEASRATGIVFATARYVSDVTGFDSGATSTTFEFLANIVLFVPLGLLVTIAWPRTRPWVVVLLGLVLSVTIEAVQMMLPSRFPTLSDVIANTVGAGVGWLIARTIARAVVRAVVRDRHRVRDADAPRPTVGAVS